MHRFFSQQSSIPIPKILCGVQNNFWNTGWHTVRPWKLTYTDIHKRSYLDIVLNLLTNQQFHVAFAFYLPNLYLNILECICTSLNMPWQTAITLW